MTTRLAGHSDSDRVHSQERRQYRALYAVGFAVFVVAGAFERGMAHLTGRAEAHPGSIFDNARAAADSSIPFAFMGW